MLRQLKARIKKQGMASVASALGYKSSQTIYNWIKTNKIPDLAKHRVKEYLNESK